MENVNYQYDVAFVIPAYNIEEYLSDCLESVLKQTEISKQIIIVNDGSKDNTLAIANDYASKYTFITVIDKQNEGVSVARNVGIEHSDAEYICFLDGDDVYIDDFAHLFLKYCRMYELDIIRGKYSMYDKGDIYGEYPNKTVCDKRPVSGSRFLKMFLKERCSEVVPWLGFFKKTFLQKNNIFFPKGITYTEDQLFYLEALCNECSCMDVDCVFYGYRVRQGSATRNGYSEKKVNDVIEMTKREIALTDAHPELQKEILRFTSTTLSQVFPFYKLGNKEQKRYITSEIKKLPYNRLIMNSYSVQIRLKLFLACYCSGLFALIYK